MYWQTKASVSSSWKATQSYQFMLRATAAVHYGLHSVVFIKTALQSDTACAVPFFGWMKRLVCSVYEPLHIITACGNMPKLGWHSSCLTFQFSLSLSFSPLISVSPSLKRKCLENKEPFYCSLWDVGIDMCQSGKLYTSQSGGRAAA